MSAPLSGHPDWQAYANWRGTLVQTGFVNYAPGTTVIGGYVFTNYASVYISLIQQFGTGQLILTWYNDQAQTFVTESIPLNLAGNTIINVLMPADGNLLSVSVNNTGAGNLNFNLNILPMNIAVGKPVFHVNPNIVAQTNFTVGINTFVNVAIANMFAGMTYLYFDPQDGANKLTFRIYTIDLNGAQNQRICNFSALAAPSHQLIVMPSTPCIAQIINSDVAATHTYSWALTATGQ